MCIILLISWKWMPGGHEQKWFKIFVHRQLEEKKNKSGNWEDRVWAKKKKKHNSNKFFPQCIKLLMHWKWNCETRCALRLISISGSLQLGWEIGDGFSQKSHNIAHKNEFSVDLKTSLSVHIHRLFIVLLLEKNLKRLIVKMPIYLLEDCWKL